MAYKYKYNILTHSFNVIKEDWATSGANIYNTNAGNVGIGTSSPGAYKLLVYHAGSTGVVGELRFRNQNNAYTSLNVFSNGVGFSMTAHSNGIGYISGTSALNFTNNQSGYDSTLWLGNGYRFWLRNSSATADYLAVTTSGNFGVGINTPACKFHTYTTSDVIARFTSSTPAQGGTGGSALEIQGFYAGRPRLVPMYENGTAGTTLVLLSTTNQSIHIIDSNRRINAEGTGLSGVGNYLTFAARHGFKLYPNGDGDTFSGLEISKGIASMNYNYLTISGASSGSVLAVTKDGYVGINKSSPTSLLDVAGTVTANQYKLSALNTEPSSATDTGVVGEIRITSGYIYVCIATNTWVRSQLTTW